jgi:hypothetical protein
MSELDREAIEQALEAVWSLTRWGRFGGGSAGRGHGREAMAQTVVFQPR